MTELMWEGKYVNGKKTAPVRLALPFQDVETVNESAQQRQLMLDMWSSNQPGDWRNRLIWGDKKYVLPSLLPEFAGKVNLIYIDPPFDTGADFSYAATIPDDPDTEGDQSANFVKQPSMIEQKAYRDTWGHGLDGYLQWFYETVLHLYELLAENGSIYVHLDWHVGHYAKAILDEIFGVGNFRSEIVREKSNPKNYTRLGYGNIHDIILFYSKSDQLKWVKPYITRDEAKIALDFPQVDNNGKLYKTAPLHAPGIRYGESGRPWRDLMPPQGNHWRYVHSTLEQLEAEGRIEWSSTGNPREKIYADESGGLFLQDIWLGVKDSKGEYPSMKNPDILKRIINASCEQDDIVLDCFCGSGTTATIAEELGRRWITADLGRFAIHTTRKRLLSISDVHPFVVQNLGKYERQAWQAAEFGEDKERAALAQARYRDFILKLYGARPLNGYTWLHGEKAGHMVHVGSVDAPVLLGDIKAIAQEFWKAVGKDSGASTNSVDVLGWDFAFELNEMGKQMAADANIKMTFKRIPREVLEKKAVEQGDIKFFELAALGTKVEPGKGRTVTVELCDFMVPPDDMTEDVQKAITHWSQLIDYWAIDWDYRGDTFHNQWQNYRKKKDPKLQLYATNTYDTRGTYTVVVKVIDILGNDTTKAVQVEVQ